MKRIRHTIRVLIRPLDRARALRSDDRAQVMVLTGVMVFVIMIMGLATLNTSKGIHDRMKAQNAVDAAADAYALWQARGMNLEQHINDVHLEMLSIAYWIEFPACLARIGCPFLNAVPFVGAALAAACCAATAILITPIEAAQDIVSEVLLVIQEVLNFAMPIIGFFAANSIAMANGADPVIGALVGTIEDYVAGIGINIDVASTIANVPGVDAIFIFPLLPDKAFTLNVERADPPGIIPWRLDEATVTLCTSVLCTVPASCTGGCGWDDTFMFGYPSYNTWLAGKMGENILPGLEELSWLHAGHRRDPDVNVSYARADEFALEDTGGSNIPRFKNQAVVVIASSQASGHRDETLQPVVETSDVSGFRFARPQLISVHVGDPASDDDITSKFIWH